MNPYLPNTDEDRKKMLESIGAASIDDLFADIPEKVRLGRKLDIPDAMPEFELRKYFKGLAGKNVSEYNSFLGAGLYSHFIPSAVKHIVSRSEFYTAYTPYQAEISQGLLQAIFEYQTMMCELTALDVSNASMYDGATAAAEAAIMAVKTTGRSGIIVPKSLNPQVMQVLKTYSKGIGFSIIEIGYCGEGSIDVKQLESCITSDTAAVLIQTPNFFGIIENVEDFSKTVHDNGSLLITYVDPVSLGILKPPGECGADIAVGDAQCFGNHLNFGGPSLGFLTASEKLMRAIPGRIVGETVDAEGNKGYVLTLQAREQHIRRENALSNICSNQALNALAAAVYLSLTGKKGLKKVGELCLQKAHYAFDKLTAVKGIEPVFSGPFFKEFAVRLPINAQEAVNKLLGSGIIPGYSIGSEIKGMENVLLVCVTETKTKNEIDELADALAGISQN